MLGKGAKVMDIEILKKIEWIKPAIVSLGSAVAILTKGENSIACIDCLSGGHTGGGLRCYSGSGVKK